MFSCGAASFSVTCCAWFYTKPPLEKIFLVFSFHNDWQVVFPTQQFLLDLQKNNNLQSLVQNNFGWKLADCVFFFFFFEMSGKLSVIEIISQLNVDGWLMQCSHGNKLPSTFQDRFSPPQSAVTSAWSGVTIKGNKKMLNLLFNLLSGLFLLSRGWFIKYTFQKQSVWSSRQIGSQEICKITR